MNPSIINMDCDWQKHFVKRFVKLDMFERFKIEYIPKDGDFLEEFVIKCYTKGKYQELRRLQNTLTNEELSNEDPIYILYFDNVCLSVKNAHLIEIHYNTDQYPKIERPSRVEHKFVFSTFEMPIIHRKTQHESR